MLVKMCPLSLSVFILIVGLFMKLFKAKPTPNSSDSRLMDDGYADAQSGKAALSSQLFESPVDYQIYMTGYDRGMRKDKSVSGTLDPDSFCVKPHPNDLPFIACSGVTINFGGSGRLNYKIDKRGECQVGLHDVQSANVGANPAAP